jgi:hypothetical protein
MLRFFLKRYAQAVSERRLWVLLAFVPLIIYLVVSAIVPDRFTVKQEISISGNALIALSPRSADLRALSELISTPSYFFQNKFALILLGKRLDLEMRSESAQNPLLMLKRDVVHCLSLTMPGQNTAVIAYEGKDRKRGEAMVVFYSQRLIKQAKDWLAQNRSGIEKGLAAPKMVGKITVEEQHAPWRSERLLPAVYIFVISLIVLLVIIALLDWFNPSFRSERHIAYYLQVPILGTLPDLKRIAEVMKSVPHKE